MTKLERIATDHRVRTRLDSCADPIIPGNNGHLYTDDGAVMACFTDDGRKKPLTVRYKTERLKMLKPFMIRMKQEGDCEFIAEIQDTQEALRCALFRVLKVKRLMVTAGVSKPLPPGLVAFLDSKRNKRAKTDS